MATRILVKPLRARFGKDGYPVWKTAQLEIQGPAGTGHPSATTLVQSMKANRSKTSRSVRRSKGQTPGTIRPSANLPVVNGHAGGIDVGSTEHYVCVPEDAVGEDESNVRSFRTFSGELNKLVEWLQQCGVRTVALESTGVFWIPLVQKLDYAGLWGGLGKGPPLGACAGAQERCQRLPVASAAPQLWPAQRVVPSDAGDLRVAQLDAPPGEPHPELWGGGSAHAAGLKPDERALASRGERSERRDGTEDSGCDSGRATRPEGTGEVARPPVPPVHRRGASRCSGGGLADRTPVCPPAGPGNLPSSAGSDGQVRSADRGVPGQGDCSGGTPAGAAVHTAESSESH